MTIEHDDIGKIGATSGMGEAPRSWTIVSHDYLATPAHNGAVVQPVFSDRGHVLRNDHVAGEYWHMVLEVPESLAGAAPGQFYQMLCESRSTATPAPFLRRPMSIYLFDRERRRLEFLYKVTGSGTAALAEHRCGDAVGLVGPLGVGFRLQDSWKHILIVARGVGLATLAPLAEAARERGIRSTVILSARSPELLLSEDRFRRNGAAVSLVVDTDHSSDVESVERSIRGFHAAAPFDAFFTCGSNRLLKLLKLLGHDLKVGGQVAIEQQMACGLGMCFCCVRPIVRNGRTEQLRVCHDGPVFALEEVESW
jgi:dihydroorotate dehydrogenase electron transfer subunit